MKGAIQLEMKIITASQADILYFICIITECHHKFRKLVSKQKKNKTRQRQIVGGKIAYILLRFIEITYYRGNARYYVTDKWSLIFTQRYGTRCV